MVKETYLSPSFEKLPRSPNKPNLKQILGTEYLQMKTFYDYKPITQCNFQQTSFMCEV